MVHLSLSTTKGNAGIRYFPFQGYLGLTPVRIDGVVRTRCDEDQKPIQATSLTVYVRAYESRLVRIGQPHSRIVAEHSHVVWRKPEGQSFANLGDFDAPFKITIPKRSPGFSTANFQDYRTYWRLEAVLEHSPSHTIGSRMVKYFDLALIRYDVPPPLPPPPPSPLAVTCTDAVPSGSGPSLHHVTIKPRAPVLYYNLSTPPYPIGPSDLLFVSLFIRPQDPSVSIRSASLLVERRIELTGIDFPPGSGSGALPSLSTSPPIVLSSSLPEKEPDEEKEPHGYAALAQASHSTSTLTSTVSTNTITSRTALLSLDRGFDPPPSPPPMQSGSPPNPASTSSSPEKVSTTSVAASTFPSFSLDASTGVYNKTVSLPWPESKSHARWSMGETMRGNLAAVSFWVRVKVIVTSSNGTESVELAPREVSVVLTNDTERRSAMAHFAAAHARSIERRRASTAPGATSSHPSPSIDNGGDFIDSESLLGVGMMVPAYETGTCAYIPPKSADAASTYTVGTVASAPTPSRSPVTVPVHSSRISVPEGKKHVRSQAHPPRRKTRRPHTSAGPQDRDLGRDSINMPIPLPVEPPTTMTDTTNVPPPRHTSPILYPYLLIKPHSPTNSSFSHTRRSSASSHPHSDGTTPSTSPSISSPISLHNGEGRKPLAPLPSTGKRERANSPGGRREREFRALAATQPQPGPGTDLVRAWEEELVRIEKASKRGSQDMLGFARRRERTRVSGETEVRMLR